MNTTFSNISHQKSVLKELKSAKGLPFSEILSSEIMIKNIENLEYRHRFFSPDVTLWMFLSQVLDDDQSLQATVTRSIAFFLKQGLKAPSPNTAAYSKARTRIPEEFLSRLVRESGECLEKETSPTWLWKGKHVKMLDGSTLSMPDTPENQEIYPQRDSQKQGAGFPIARVVAVISCSTGAALDLAIGAYTGKKTGEHALLGQLMNVFEAGDVALGDAYYASYFLMASLINKGVDAVFPIHASRDCDFRRGKRLGKKDHVVQWIKPKKPEWMDEETYNSFQNTIMIRELTFHPENRGFRTKSRVIVTTFLDSKDITKADLTTLYSHRWRIELDFNSIKETMHMGILRGKTPEMVRKEIWVHLLAYNLIRKIMAQSAYIHNKNPRELSFKLALRCIESFRESNIFSEKNGEIYMQLLKIIAYKKVGNRPNRHEPRRIKRRPKSFPRLQKSRGLYRKSMCHIA
jgi:Transposase DDE domain